MQLQPQEIFTVVRQLHDWSDTDTNYVQAVIRNARTDELLATLNLTDKGSRRFSKTWQVKADPSGLGFYITITTTVFTDSGYTTKNSNYGEEMNTYLVDERKRNLGGSGGNDVDYKKIRDIFKEEKDDLKLILEQEVLPKLVTFEYPIILNAIAELSSQIELSKPGPIEIPNYTENLIAIVQQIQALESSLSLLQENLPKVNLEPLESKIEGIKESFKDSLADISESLEDYSQAIVTKIDNLSEGEEETEMPEESPILQKAKKLRS